MNNPLQRLKQLPWVPLLLVALLTVFWASVLEIVLASSATYLKVIQDTLLLLFTPPLDTLIAMAIAMGIGALSVMFLEIVYPQVIISSGILWALIFCLFVILFIRDALPSPLNLLEPSSVMLIGSLLGVFLKGKPYWR